MKASKLQQEGRVTKSIPFVMIGFAIIMDLISNFYVSTASGFIQHIFIFAFGLGSLALLVGYFIMRRRNRIIMLNVHSTDSRSDVK